MLWHTYSSTNTRTPSWGRQRKSYYLYIGFSIECFFFGLSLLFPIPFSVRLFFIHSSALLPCACMLYMCVTTNAVESSLLLWNFSVYFATFCFTAADTHYMYTFFYLPFFVCPFTCSFCVLWYVFHPPLFGRWYLLLIKCFSKVNREKYTAGPTCNSIVDVHCIPLNATQIKTTATKAATKAAAVAVEATLILTAKYRKISNGTRDPRG